MQVRRMMSEGRIRHRRNKHMAPNGTAKEVPILPATITHGKRVTGSAKVLQDDNIRHQLKESRSNAEMNNSDEDEYISFSTKRPFKPGDMEDYTPVHGDWMLRKQSKYRSHTIFNPEICWWNFENFFPCRWTNE